MDSHAQKEKPLDPSNLHPFAPSFYTHDRIKISEQPGPLKLVLSPYTGYKNLPRQKTALFTIDSHGFRITGKESDHPNSQRVILLGGSSAFGQEVKDDETIAFFLHQNNPRLKVINAGVVGFHTAQELSSLVTELVHYRPDVVVAYDGWNDLFIQWLIRDQKEIGDHSFAFRMIEELLIENYKTRVSVKRSFDQLMKILMERSAVLSFLQEKIARLKQKFSNTHLLSRKGELKEIEPERLNFAVEQYVGNLKEMKEFCESQGIQFLVVIQPELERKSVKTKEEMESLREFDQIFSGYASQFPKLYELFIQRSKERLQTMGVPFLDIGSLPEFSGYRGRLFADPVHTNQMGNAIAAKLIHQKLTRLKKR